MCRVFRSVVSKLRRGVRHGSAFALALTLTVGVCSQTASAQNTYMISDGDRVLYHTTLTADTDAIITEAGLTVEDADQVTTDSDGGISQIVINRSQVITVECDGELLVTGSYGGTVQDVLDSLSITLAESDICSVALDAETYDGMCIEITRMTERIVYTEEAIPYSTEYYEDETLPVGESQQVTAGVDGTVRYAWLVSYEDGQEVSRTLLSSAVLSEPVNQVVLTHTDRTIHEHDSMLESDALESDVEENTISEEAASAPATQTTAAENTITTASGDVLTYSSVLTCTATAYTGGGTTATGTSARVGAIAVDPSVIPLGSILYIVADDGYCIYGYCVAEDTGSAIKGNRVDLYFNTYSECINFGRRSVTVYVLQTP